MPNCTLSSKGYTLDAHTGYSKEQMDTSPVLGPHRYYLRESPWRWGSWTLFASIVRIPGLVSDLWLHLLRLLCSLLLTNKAGNPLLFQWLLPPSLSARIQKKLIDYFGFYCHQQVVGDWKSKCTRTTSKSRSLFHLPVVSASVDTNTPSKLSNRHLTKVF